MNNKEIFEELEKRNISKVEVQFSGGHDEGGVDDIVVTFNNEETEQWSETWEKTVWNPITRKFDPIGESNSDIKLNIALCKPVYNKYYSFAGEFYVNGVITWDVLNKSVKLNGTEEVSTYEEYEEELDG